MASTEVADQRGLTEREMQVLSKIAANEIVLISDCVAISVLGV